MLKTFRLILTLALSARLEFVFFKFKTVSICLMIVRKLGKGCFKIITPRFSVMLELSTILGVSCTTLVFDTLLGMVIKLVHETVLGMVATLVFDTGLGMVTTLVFDTGLGMVTTLFLVTGIGMVTTLVFDTRLGMVTTLFLE